MGALNYIVSFVFVFCLLLDGSFAEKPNYKISSILEEPFLMEKQGEDLTGNERYEGYCKDLVDAIAENAGFTYELSIVQDGQLGSRQSDGTWNGIVGEVQGGEKAQIGIGPILIREDKMRVVDVSLPFLEYQLGILTKKQSGKSETDVGEDENEDHAILVFLRPMSTILWLFFVIVVIKTSITLFFMDRYVANITKVNADEPSGLCSSGLFGSPRSCTGRILQVLFWIFLLSIFMTAYASTVACERARTRLPSGQAGLARSRNSEMKVTSVEDVIAHSAIKLGTLKGSTIYNYLQNTNGKYRDVYREMVADKGLVSTTEEGVKRVRDSNGTYTFITDGVSAKYLTTKKPCDLEVVEELFGPISGYGVISQKGSPAGQTINLAIEFLREHDKLEYFEKKWFQDRSECKERAQNFQESLEENVRAAREEPKSHNQILIEVGIMGGGILLLLIILGMISAYLEIRHYEL